MERKFPHAPRAPASRLSRAALPHPRKRAGGNPRTKLVQEGHHSVRPWARRLAGALVRARPFVGVPPCSASGGFCGMRLARSTPAVRLPLRRAARIQGLAGLGHSAAPAPAFACSPPVAGVTSHPPLRPVGTPPLHPPAAVSVGAALSGLRGALLGAGARPHPCAGVCPVRAPQPCGAAPASSAPNPQPAQARAISASGDWALVRHGRLPSMGLRGFRCCGSGRGLSPSRPPFGGSARKRTSAAAGSFLCHKLQQPTHLQIGCYLPLQVCSVWYGCFQPFHPLIYPAQHKLTHSFRCHSFTPLYFLPRLSRRASSALSAIA